MYKFYILIFSLLSISLEAQTFQFQSWNNTEGIENFGSFSTSIVDSSGVLWIGSSSSKIGAYTDETWTVYNLAEIFEGSVGSSARINDIHMAKNGDLWAISDKGIFRKSGEDWTFYEDELEKSFGYTIAEKEGDLYFSTRGGVMTFIADTWGYEEISGNQPGYVAVDGQGVVWVSFSNGSGNYRKVDDTWEYASKDETGICTDYALGSGTTAEGIMWIYGASGAACSYDGTEFKDYKYTGGTVSIQNALAFSPSGSHVFIGGKDFSSDLLLKHIYNGEVVEVYSPESGLPAEEIFSIAVDSESSLYVFTQNEIYRGEPVSHTSELPSTEVTLIQNPVLDQLTFDRTVSGNAFIYSLDGSRVSSGQVVNGSLDVSSLQSGFYFLRFENNISRDIIKFVKM